MMGLPRRRKPIPPPPDEREYRLATARDVVAQLEAAAARCDRATSTEAGCSWHVRKLGDDADDLPILAIRCARHAGGRFTAEPPDASDETDLPSADDAVTSAVDEERAYRLRAASMYATQLETTGSLCDRVGSDGAGCHWDVAELDSEPGGAPVVAIRCTTHSGGRYSGHRSAGPGMA